MSDDTISFSIQPFSEFFLKKPQTLEFVYTVRLLIFHLHENQNPCLKSSAAIGNVQIFKMKKFSSNIFKQISFEKYLLEMSSAQQPLVVNELISRTMSITLGSSQNSVDTKKTNMFSLSPGPPKRTDLLVWYHHISVI
jgi:hypothetical protein